MEDAAAAAAAAAIADTDLREGSAPLASVAEERVTADEEEEDEEDAETGRTDAR